jgi:murein DD-endopeptidase MepM/ murein hydrolase activator NlpD
MVRRCAVLLILGFALIVGAPAYGGDNLGQQKATLDAKLVSVQAKIAAARAREARLHTQIGSLTTQIQTLETRIGGVSSRLSTLRADLALHQRRLATLNRLYQVQTVRFRDLRHEYSLAVLRLDRRLISIYKQPDPGTLDLVLQAKSFQDVIDELDYLGLLAKADDTIATQVKTAKLQVAAARRQTAAMRQTVANEANKINAYVQQEAILRSSLLANQGKLAGAKAGKAHALVATKAQEQAALRESQAIQAASAAIEARIRAAQAGPSDTTTGGTAAAPSSAGLVWPVQGPITSPFGPRWGGFHPGIDIGIPEGTPIHAAAAGTVILCGWESGYGNLVVLDHHDGIATAYAHQSRIAVDCNQNVDQGEVIGYSGCTGFCTGPHLHFEVRVNGSPVDPLGYLP